MQHIDQKVKKRILKDRKDLIKYPLDDMGIHVVFNDENIMQAYALVIGPSETRYENGFYLFKITYPTNYPYSPMKFEFLTSNGKTRMHPNLYVNGKVCLSILGTWTGEGWTSCQTTKSVLLSVLTIFNMNPINNEPGYTDYSITSDLASRYNQIIDYQNLYLAAYKMSKRKDTPCPELQKIMQNYIIKHYDWYVSKIKENMKNDNIVIRTSIYNLSEQLKYKDLLHKFEKLYLTLSTHDKCQINTIDSSNDVVDGNTGVADGNNDVVDGNTDVVDGNTDVVDSSNISDQQNKVISKDNSKKNTRKAPSQPSKNYEVGYKIKSDNDNGNYYMVKQIKNGTRWVKCM